MTPDDLALDLGKLAAVVGIIATVVVILGLGVAVYGAGVAMGLYLAAWWVWLRTTPVPFV